MQEGEPRYEVVAGAGGDAPIDEDTIRSLKSEIDRITTRCAEFQTFRYNNDVVRFNIWPGRSFDGRNWTETADMFEGQSDQPVWLADSVINERVQQGVIALMRAQIRCEPSGLGADARSAAKWSIILRWLISRMGARWIKEHIKLWNYEDSDTPAIALMRVYWRHETGLEMKTLTADEIAAKWIDEYAGAMADAGRDVQPEEPQQQAMQFLAFMTDPASDLTAVVAMIQDMFPRLKPKRAKKIAQQIAKDGSAEFPLEIVSFDGPEIGAKRFALDFFVPDSIRDFDDCSCWFELEWISASELRQRETTMGWDAEFIEDVLKKRGNAAFLDSTIATPAWLANYSSGLHQNEYQVVWAHFLATNEDGISARYYTVLDYSGTRTAHGMKLEALPNRWPGVLHRREIIDDFALNSRGVPEIVGPEQFTIKRMRDLQVNGAEISTLPPFTTNDGRGSEEIFLAPLKHLALSRPGAKAEFLQPPQPATAARLLVQDIEKGASTYWGRKTADTDPNMLAMQQEFDVGLRLASVKDELQILLDLAMQEMPDSMIQQIMGPDNMPVAKSKEEIAGHYDVVITFDPAQLDHERLVDIINALPAIKQLDPQNRLDMAPAAEYAYRALLPQIAEGAIRPAEVGVAHEADEAKRHLIAMRNGMQVPVDETGAWNYELRIKTIEDALTQDPDQNSISPAYLQNISAFLAAMKFQYQQHVVNKQTGRQGVKGGQGAEAPEGE
jgi:hypothetical protein